ncbi:MAG: tRNA (N(6)-L-threonylcarbamoyladenosine(37)-C(2))-methylthiotransferase MtaB, partial [Gammaproteobacteria bacterium]|nr:tRNA (N(6)-L-threonylcarbamoyladenosine(37)-C(2))-methylthiotransferase MtaB [Gammaproteobacteria bacterium]
HVFPFSPRDGTRAATLSDPVPIAVRRRRAAEMQALGDRLRRAHLEAQVGRVASVLLEGEADASPAAGYTPDYLRVLLDRPLRDDEVGAIRDVRLVGLAGEGTALAGRACG